MNGFTLTGRRARADANLRGAIYGIVSAAAVIAATAAHDERLGNILSATIGTLVIFWLVHVYTEVVAHHLAGHRLGWTDVTTAMVRELPVIEAPLLSVLLLVAGVLDLLDRERAVTLALWAAVAQLVSWGIAYARQQGWSWRAAVLTGGVDGVFGVGIIVLKALLH